MSSIFESALRDLETKVRHALKSGDETALRVIGYGEISTVLLNETPEGAFACKRLPIFSHRADAEEVVGMMDRYVDALRATGIEPVASESKIVESNDGSFVVYSVQPALNPQSLGPDHLRTLSADDALREIGRIWDLIEKSVSPTLAPDGQLSNWAFVDDHILYVDVSTPFMRDEAGNELLNWKLYTTTVPGPIRWYFMHEVPKIMDKYHSLRGQITDFIANLYKEKLEHLVPELIALANDRFQFDEPLTEASVRAYYKDDAATYELLQRVKRADRWWQSQVLRRTYPYLLPPKLERNVR